MFYVCAFKFNQKKTSIETISQEHISHSKECQLVKAFPQTALETLPKMLDDCNFVKFRLGVDF